MFIRISVSIAQGRSRREKKDKYGRFAALAKLKEAKARGEKHKYDVSQVKLLNVKIRKIHTQEKLPLF